MMNVVMMSFVAPIIVPLLSDIKKIENNFLNVFKFIDINITVS